MLRNPLDTEKSKTNGTAMGNLFAGGSWRPPAAPAPRPRIVQAKVMAPPVIREKTPQPPISVEVINGAKRVESKFPAAGEAIP